MDDDFDQWFQTAAPLIGKPRQPAAPVAPVETEDDNFDSWLKNALPVIEASPAAQFAYERDKFTAIGVLYRAPDGSMRRRSTQGFWQADPIDDEDPQTARDRKIVAPLVESYQAPRDPTTWEKIDTFSPPMAAGPLAIPLMPLKWWWMDKQRAAEPVTKSRIVDTPETRRIIGASEAVSARRGAELSTSATRGLHGSVRVPLESAQGGFVNTAKPIVDFLESRGIAPENAASSLVRQGDAEQEIFDERAGDSEFSKLARRAGTSMTQTLMASATGGGTPMMIASFAGTAYTDSYTRAKDSGKSDKEAREYAAAHAVNEGLWTAAFAGLEKRLPGAGGVESAIKKGMIKEAREMTLGGLATRGIKRLGFEGVEEGGIHVTGNYGINKAYDVDYAPYEDATGSFFDTQGKYGKPGELMPGWKQFLATMKQTGFTVGMTEAPGAAAHASGKLSARAEQRLIAGELQIPEGAARWAAEGANKRLPERFQLPTAGPAPVEGDVEQLKPAGGIGPDTPKIPVAPPIAKPLPISIAQLPQARALDPQAPAFSQQSAQSPAPERTSPAGARALPPDFNQRPRRAEVRVDAAAGSPQARGQPKPQSRPAATPASAADARAEQARRAAELRTPEGAAKWAAENPELARLIVNNRENQSRGKIANITRSLRNAWGKGPARDRFLAQIEGALGEQKTTAQPSDGPQAPTTTLAGDPRQTASAVGRKAGAEYESKTAATTATNTASSGRDNVSQATENSPSPATPSSSRIGKPSNASSSSRGPNGLSASSETSSPQDERPNVRAQATVPTTAPSVTSQQVESDYGTVSGATPARSESGPASTPPAATLAEGGFATLTNGSRVELGKGNVTENGHIVVPGKGGKPGRTFPASAVVRVESSDGRPVWRRPPHTPTSTPRPTSQSPANSSIRESPPNVRSDATVQPSREAPRGPNAPRVPNATNTSPTPQAAHVPEGGYATLENGSRVAFGPGAVSENGDIVVPSKGGKPGQTIPASKIVHVETPDERSVWRRPPPASRGPTSGVALSGQSPSKPGSRNAAPLRPQVTKADVEEAFRGQRVVENRDGSFRVELQNGKFLTVRKVDDIGPLSRQAAERSMNRELTEQEWADFRVRGAWTITSSEGRRTDTYGLIRLVNGEADSKTLRHEMLHAARSLGLLSKAEWQALVHQHAPNGKTDGHAEERVAEAYEAWRGPEGLWQRLKSAINRVLSKLGVVNPSADTALARLRDGSVWSRESAPETNAEARERSAGEVRYSGEVRKGDGSSPDDAGNRDSGRIGGSHEDAVARLVGSKPTVVPRDKWTANTTQARKKVVDKVAAEFEAKYGDKNPLVNKSSGKRIIVSTGGLGHLGLLSVDRTKWSLIHSLDGLLRNAVHVASTKAGTGKSGGRGVHVTHALGNVVDIGGKLHVVKHTLHENADGAIHYARTAIVSVKHEAFAHKTQRPARLNADTRSAKVESAVRRLFGIKSRGARATVRNGNGKKAVAERPSGEPLAVAAPPSESALPNAAAGESSSVTAKSSVENATSSDKKFDLRDDIESSIENRAPGVSLPGEPISPVEDKVSADSNGARQNGAGDISSGSSDTVATPQQPLLLTYQPTSRTESQIRRLPQPDKWRAGEEHVQELYGSNGQRHFAVPAGGGIEGDGGRFVDAPVDLPNGGVLAVEVKTYGRWRTVSGVPQEQTVPLSDEIREQILKDVWLCDNHPNYDPRWIFLDAPPSKELQDFLNQHRIVNVTHD